MELTGIGHRLSGSAGAEKAVAWAKHKMESYGFDKVYLQPMMAVNWSRGSTERATLIDAEQSFPLNLCAIGGSVGTGEKEIGASVIEVKSLEEVDRLADAVRGKIVFYNKAMDPKIDPSDAYGNTVDQRVYGAAKAGKYGATAVLVRSLTSLIDDDHPHTGSLHYKDGITEIPAAALSVRSANLLSQHLKENPATKVKLELSAKMEPPVPSFNVIGEITGREFPKEYVVVSGHLDSWDLGTGAHDDGAGVVETIETLRALGALKIRPRRTVRAVLFMSEEYGGVGGKQYLREVKANGEKHVAALESDQGGFNPAGFDVTGNPEIVKLIENWKPYLKPLHADRITTGSGGTDVDPLGELGVPTLGLVIDSTHYFDIHHSALDRIEAVNPKELCAGTSAVATLTYLLAEEGLGK